MRPATPKLSFPHRFGVVGLLVWSLSWGCAAGDSPPAAGQATYHAEGAVKTIVLQDVQALRGGQKLFLRSDGTGVCQVIAWNREAGGFYEKRYRLALSPVQLHPLLERVNAEAFQTISIQERPGLPDEARPTISLTLASGKALKISKWLGDKHQEFDAVYQNLLALVQSAKQTKPEVEGKYDRQWVPEGFSLP